jgi:predicted ATPase
LAERISDPFSVVTASLYVAMVHLNRGEPELALQRLAAAEPLAAEQRVGLVVVPEILRGTALTVLGEFDEAVACLRRGLAGGPKVTRVRTYGLAGLSEALSQRGEHAAALATAKEGLQTQEETGHRQWHAELHRLEGVALLGLNKLEDAQSAFYEALRVSRRQQAKAYELRAARDLSRLWGEQRRPAEGRDLLAPVYGWFAEGFDTADLKEAKVLLEELA